MGDRVECLGPVSAAFVILQRYLPIARLQTRHRQQLAHRPQRSHRASPQFDRVDSSWSSPTQRHGHVTAGMKSRSIDCRSHIRWHPVAFPFPFGIDAFSVRRRVPQSAIHWCGTESQPVCQTIISHLVRRLATLLFLLGKQSRRQILYREPSMSRLPNDPDRSVNRNDHGSEETTRRVWLRAVLN